MIRFILAAIFVFLFLLFSYILFFIEWIIGKFNKEKKDAGNWNESAGFFPVR